MVVFLGIRPGQVPEEPQPEGLDPFRDWQAATPYTPSLFPQTLNPKVISTSRISVLSMLPWLFQTAVCSNTARRTVNRSEQAKS